MIKKPVTIKKNMAMEDRPVAHLVQEASQVYIEMEDKKINAKSIMGMMSLSLQEGEDITVVAEGKDEKEAVAGVEGFLTTRK
ncbi:HPr family phosphocarrier protein [[Clostridium] scindens]|uniref:HPr-like protein Crh n=1 Tax=Clostridium scindens (strain ATCC 35704 / DSM 5676 / VPI 13733 / 19) TaxID=411468 RepID=A0A494WN03_CLOS5|nr:HPr family phosphocarrier protein [[Clostridium] scindens]QBF73290.1 HPr-like protein Crh [[Clostridium] scindens ATCC 35704]